LYKFAASPINLGMQTILRDIPKHLITLIEALRSCLRDEAFLARHRVRPQDFTRHRQLTFPIIMLFVLQQTVKSIQRHVHEFLDELAQGSIFEPLTPGAVTHARAKLKASAFIELNQQCVLPTVYGPEHPIQRWHEHRLFGIDSSLLRLPDSPELGQVFGWKEVSNQKGATGTRFPEARLSVVYDLLNRVGHQTRLEPSTVGEVALAIEQIQQLESLQPGDIAINDRGFTGYLYFAEVVRRGLHFIGRCSTGSFLAAQEMFRLNRANQSRVVWLMCPPEQKAECVRRGLPLKMKVRFVSVRLPTGELEVLATSLLDEELYPSQEFLGVYHCRWGHETFHLMLKGRLEVENFSGRTLEAVQQDVQAAVLLANLESVLSEPTQAALDEQTQPKSQPRKVNRANSYHALKDQVLDLLYRDIPVARVIHKLMKLFQGSPVAVRPNRKVPRRRKPSFHRSYHFQRRVKKIVF
jgi:hypothetical protein